MDKYILDSHWYNFLTCSLDYEKHFELWEYRTSRTNGEESVGREGELCGHQSAENVRGNICEFKSVEKPIAEQGKRWEFVSNYLHFQSRYFSRYQTLCSSNKQNYRIIFFVDNLIVLNATIIFTPTIGGKRYHTIGWDIELI